MSSTPRMPSQPGASGQSMPLPVRDATGSPPASLRPLFAALDAAAAARLPIPLETLRGVLAAVDVTAESLGDAIQIDSARYVRTLVHRTESAEVLVMAWLPGQRSPIHDHAGSACAVRVVSGEALEQVYLPNGDGTVSAHGAPRRLARGGVTGSFDADIHALGNAAAGPAPTRDILVTIHVYSPPLRPTGKYVERLDDARRDQRSAVG